MFHHQTTKTDYLKLMNYSPFNRKYLKQHSRLAVFIWIITSVAWMTRTIKVKSGQFEKLITIKQYEVYAPVSRIHKETGVSIGRCHQLLIEFEEAKLIEKRSIEMYAPVKAPTVIKIINPEYIKLVNYLKDQYPHVH